MPVLLGKEAQTQVDRENDHQQQEKLYRTVIRTGKGGGDDHGQNKNCQRVNAKLPAPAEQINTAAQDAKTQADAKTQIPILKTAALLKEGKI